MKIEDLKDGQVLLVGARRINGGKVQLEFAEKIANPNVRPGSIAGLLNASDERFTNTFGSARRAWIAGMPSDILKMLGLDVSDLVEVGAEKAINKLNPTINGKACHIQITETTSGDDYDVANVETRAKRAGKDGDFIYSADGLHIFVKSTVVNATASHVFLTGTTRNAPASTEAIDNLLD